jgi:hypothetical protein
MDAETWWGCYEKLTKAYGKTRDMEQSGVYFDALKAMPGPTIRLAVQMAIRDSKSWPNVAALREYCVQASRENTAPAGVCGECHGDIWVDAPPIHVQDVIYRNVVRPCPQCRPKVAS